MLLEALESSGAILHEDIQSVTDTPGEVFDDYVEEENVKDFIHYFIETSKMNVKAFPFPEDRDAASKYTDLEHIVNNFRRLRLGKYYSADAKGRTKLKLIVFKYREMFAVHKWNVGRIRKDFYVHKAVFKNDRYHRTKCRPFRLSPKEKTVIAKYLKNLCENEIVTPVADGHAGVNLFLVGKTSPSGVEDKDGNEGWEELRKQYEEQFGIGPEQDDKSNSKKKGRIYKTSQSYEDYKVKNGISDEDEFQDEWMENEAMVDNWKIENALMKLEDDTIKGHQTVDDETLLETKQVHNLFKPGRGHYDREKQKIEYLEEVSKTELSPEETQKLGEPESQFSKFHNVRKIYAAIDICVAVALTYRNQAKGNSQTLLTNVMEARHTMIQAIREAKSVSTSHQPQVFAKAQGYGKGNRDSYFDYLRKLEEFYENNLIISKWTTLHKEKPYDTDEEERFFNYFTEELPYYISLMNRQPLFIISYDKGQIVLVEKYCMRDRGIPYDQQNVRVPLFIARTAGTNNYFGLRIPDGDYLYYIMQYMEDKRKKTLEMEEFNMVTSSFFNIDTRLTKEKPTKSEDDFRKTNLETTLRETKDLMKDFSRTNQKINYRPVVNCLLMNLSVEKNVTVLPEPRKDIQKVARMKIFSVLDFSNFFFQISADEKYGKDVCLVTELGTFAPNVALQGDTNSPASSTFISNSLLYKVEKGISLIDDLLFANNTVERHLEDFERILSNIAYVSEAKRPCKLRTDKIHLLTEKVEYCGNILRDGKVKISSHKLDDYLKNEPTTYGQMVSVICLANWYAPALSIGSEVFKEIRDEIKPFSVAATIKWTEKLRKNYEQVIGLLREVPPMFIPDWDDEDLTFTIHVDSSQMALGGLLGQEVKIKEGDTKPSKVPLSGKGMPGSYQKKDTIKTVIQPITYYSRVLNPNEKNLPIMHLELRAMYESCLKFREYTRGSCKVKLYSDNSGVYYLLKKMLNDPNLRLDDNMAKIVALLHGTRAEIHFVSTEMNPADFMSRVIPESDPKEENKESKRCNHIKETEYIRRLAKDIEELTEFLTKGKSSERHKYRMELPRVDEDGVTHYKHGQNEYEKFPLYKLFDRLTESTKPETSSILINKRNVENLIEKAIVNNIQTDQLGWNLNGNDGGTELEHLRVKQRTNPYLNKLIKRLEKGEEKVIMPKRTQFKLKDRVLVGNATPSSSSKFKYVVPEEEVQRLTFLHHKFQHFGINKLYAHLRERYIWNLDTGARATMIQTIEEVVKACLQCAVYQRPSKHRYLETFKTLHAAQQYNCGSVVFMDHYSVGKTKSKYKEMIGAVCGRCKRAMVEPVEKGNSDHTAKFILRQICNPLIPSRLISDHGSPISLGTVPKLLEAINSGIANFYDLKEYRVGGEEQKLIEAVETKHMLQKWKEANEAKFENNEDMKAKLHETKQRIEQGRIRMRRAERERMEKLRWQKIHKNKEVRRMEHMKSSVYHPTSHSSIERFFLTFSTLIRKLFLEERDNWVDYVDQVVALYNNTGHKALRGHSPNSAHFNLSPDQTQPMIHQYLNESASRHPFVLEEQELYTRALRIFNEAGLEKYFEPRDKKEMEERKHENETGPQIGDLVWVRKMKRLDKHPEEGYLMGPCMITKKPSSQAVEVVFLLSGTTAKRHISQVTQFFRPIGTDTEQLLEYSTAPRLYANYEGRRLRKSERDKLIKELETGLQGKTYMSAIDDLEEIDMLLEDKFSLLDHPEAYSEETEKLREKFESNTPEGRALRESVEFEVEEEEEDFNEDEMETPEDEFFEEEEEDEEKTVGWELPEEEDEEDNNDIPQKKEIGCTPNENDILKTRTRSGSRRRYANLTMEKKRGRFWKTKFQKRWELEENINDENSFMLALAKRNMLQSNFFQEGIIITNEKRKRSPRRVKFSFENKVTL